jgi:regulator of PEP synthase PpsR (kinase-PPPase family)
MIRSVFFISDSTGITAETLGQSLLSHFNHIEFKKRVYSYIDDENKAWDVVDKINQAADADGAQPIVFDTVVNRDIGNIIGNSQGFLIDIISMFLQPMEKALGSPSNYDVGRPQHADEDKSYKDRIDAVQYALSNDDGAKIDHYDEADLILIGVSRCGKTPTCLYLALQNGIYAANYPLTDDDMDGSGIPRALKPFQNKLFGLIIDPQRLSEIRQERRSNSRYASIMQCEDEVRQAQGLFKRFNIPYLDTTRMSIEEIATRIMMVTGFRDQPR